MSETAENSRVPLAPVDRIDMMPPGPKAYAWLTSVSADRDSRGLEEPTPELLDAILAALFDRMLKEGALYARKDGRPGERHGASRPRWQSRDCCDSSFKSRSVRVRHQATLAHCARQAGVDIDWVKMAEEVLEHFELAPNIRLAASALADTADTADDPIAAQARARWEDAKARVDADLRWHLRHGAWHFAELHERRARAATTRDAGRAMIDRLIQCITDDDQESLEKLVQVDALTVASADRARIPDIPLCAVASRSPAIIVRVCGRMRTDMRGSATGPFAGQTPLELAIREGIVPAVEILLSLGAGMNHLLGLEAYFTEAIERGLSLDAMGADATGAHARAARDDA